MEIVIRKATLDEIELLMEWRMEVLHEVFSIPLSKNTGGAGKPCLLSKGTGTE